MRFILTVQQHQEHRDKGGTEVFLSARHGIAKPTSKADGSFAFISSTKTVRMVHGYLITQLLVFPTTGDRNWIFVGFCGFEFVLLEDEWYFLSHVTVALGTIHPRTMARDPADPCRVLIHSSGIKRCRENGRLDETLAR